MDQKFVSVLEASTRKTLGIETMLKLTVETSNLIEKLIGEIPDFTFNTDHALATLKLEWKVNGVDYRETIIVRVGHRSSLLQRTIGLVDDPLTAFSDRVSLESLSVIIALSKFGYHVEYRFFPNSKDRSETLDVLFKSKGDIDAYVSFPLD